MTELAKDAAIDTLDLLTRYSFDLAGYPIDYLIDAWLRRYPLGWLRLAVIEALYQGRYKAVSVEQILNLWQRRGKPLPHFNREFERIICSRVSKTGPKLPNPSTEPASHPDANGESRTPDVQPTAPPSSVAQPAPESEPEALLAPVSGYELATDMAPVLLPKRHPLAFEQLSLSVAGDPAIRAFRPTVNSALDPSSIARATVGKYPIHQFIPAPEPSEFYSRLKAVAHAGATPAEPPSPQATSSFYTKLKTAAQTHLALGERSTPAPDAGPADPTTEASVQLAPPEESSN